jgi:hypothetical protein
VAAASQVDPQADFSRRVSEYVGLRAKLEKDVAKLPEKATPEQISAYEKALNDRLRRARRSVKQGNIFTPEIAKHFRSALAKSVKGDVQGVMKEESLDIRRNTEGEAPPKVPLRINARYPEETPVASVPPQVLRTLPQLPEGLEYRYVGSNFLLHDTRANLIVDYVPDIVPAL